jgi:hypothetical protein
MTYKLPEQTLRSGFDQRTVMALCMVGVVLGSHYWHSLRRKDHYITFRFHGDREIVKGVLTDFIEDEFNGTNCRFYASQDDPTECYVVFDEGRTPKE